MEKLQLHPKEISSVMLSHIHNDHAGGLEGILEVNPKVTVYLPPIFSG
jgi:7,8-dihydropterin-6-yl-methyl-4-(beta-D-ribofuranosyl)aminobenzene 5'-phosphate synthase